MEIANFYTLGSKLSSSTVQVQPVNLKEFNPIDPHEKYIYDEHKLIKGDYSNISFPVIFKQQDGNKLQDILDTGWVSLYLISDKMKEVLEKNAFTGWQIFEVKILDKRDKEIEGYHGLSITGRCGKIDYRKSEIIEKRLIADGPLVRYYKGLHIGLNEWDGSDFFIPNEYFGIIVTSKVVSILKEQKLTNVVFENLKDIETMFTPQ